MSSSIEENASRIMGYLASLPREEGNPSSSTGAEISNSTDLSPDDTNDAVAILYETGFVDWLKTLGTAPYDFHEVSLTPRGRLEYERALNQPQRENAIPPRIGISPTPAGSPYGFTDADWESVSGVRARRGTLLVVLGHQFESQFCETRRLVENVHRMVDEAVATYSQLPGAMHVELDFRALGAGYGEHQFNEIARYIISADIAIFETSDLNPNVMVEMGVALTWGVRVLPIKLQGRPKPPSDISGQTWADYVESGATFPDPDHSSKMVRMIERAARRKLAV